MSKYVPEIYTMSNTSFVAEENVVTGGIISSPIVRYIIVTIISRVIHHEMSGEEGVLIASRIKFVEGFPFGGVMYTMFIISVPQSVPSINVFSFG